MSETMTLKLVRPLVRPDPSLPPVTEITLTEPMAADVIDSTRDPNPAKQSLSLLSAVTKLPETMLREMAVVEFNTACAFLNQFTRMPTVRADPGEASKTISLAAPLDNPAGGAPIAELTLAEPTVDDLIAGATEETLLGTEAVMLARVTKVDVRAIRKMPATAFMEALAYLGFFTNRPLATGPASSPT